MSRSLAGHHVLFWPSLRKFAFVNEKRPEARLEDKTHADQKKCLPKIVMRSKPSSHAEVVELVDTLGSGSSARKGMGVRVSPSAPSRNQRVRRKSLSSSALFFFPTRDSPPLCPHLWKFVKISWGAHLLLPPLFVGEPLCACPHLFPCKAPPGHSHRMPWGGFFVLSASFYF